jgi:hypothetical protein
MSEGGGWRLENGEWVDLVPKNVKIVVEDGGWRLEI